MPCIFASIGTRPARCRSRAPRSISGSSRSVPPLRDANAPAAVPFGPDRPDARWHARRPTQTGSAGVSFATDRPYVLTASCSSRMGTTAAITGFLAARRFYLMEMHQFDDTVSQRFFVRVTFCSVLGERVDLPALRSEFAAVAAREEMQWQILDTRERTRVLIMESNFD